MKKNITVKDSNGTSVAKVGIKSVRFDLISDRLEYEWALWEVTVELPEGDSVIGFMEACPFAPEVSHSELIELE
jgi:hypothetical protein